MSKPAKPTQPPGVPPQPPTLHSPEHEEPTLAPPAPPPDSLTPLPEVPGYEIEKVLGRGGMGVVYRARQLSLNRPVALKMVLAGSHTGPDDLARFLTEAEAIAAVHHPGIVEIYEYGSHQGVPFFAMELCPGGSLADRLKDGPLPPADAARLVEALACAVHAAHEQSIIHRDMKPGNVLLTADGAPRITDFGLAKRLEVSHQLTHTGSVMGTPSYMAPEQARGLKDIGPPADIWSLGAVLYECLTGRPPFRGGTPGETIYQVTELDAVAPRALRPEVPRDLETITLKCLQKDPERRYPSADALADDLRRYLAGEPILARPVGAGERLWKWARRRPALAASLAVAAVTLLAGAAVSSLFAVEAGRQARQAELREVEAVAALRRLEEVLAVGLLRPLGHADRRELNDFELEALKELATLPRGRERVRLLFLEKALDQPGPRGQLDRRLEVAVHAAVGLNDALRGQVLAMLAEKSAATADDDLRDVCRRIEELLEAPGTAGPAGPDDLEPPEDDARQEARAERAEARQLPRAEALALLDRMRAASVRPTDPEGCDELRRACAAADRDDVPDAAAVTVDLAVRVLDAVEKASPDDLGPDLPRAWEHLGGPMRRPMPPHEALRLLQRILRFQATSLITFSEEEDLVKVLGTRLGEREAETFAAAALTAAARARTAELLLGLARAHAAVAGHLPRPRRQRDARALARAVQATAPLTGGADGQAALAQALAGFAAELDRPEAARLAAALLQGLPPSKPQALPARARALLALAPHLEGQARRELAELARALLAAFPRTTSPYALAAHARAFASVAPQLAPADLPPLAHSLADLATELTSPEAVSALALAFAALEPRLAAPDHRPVALALAPAYLGAAARREGPVHEPHFRPLLRALTLAEKVELLKHPACVGPGRRAVLAAIAADRGRPCPHLWEAVAWLRRERPDVDLLTPPALRPSVPAARPNPAAP